MFFKNYDLQCSLGIPAFFVYDPNCALHVNLPLISYCHALIHITECLGSTQIRFLSEKL